MYIICIQSTQASEERWYGFKIVGDNIDKNVKRRHQTVERGTMSLHYLHSFGVKDRIPCNTVDDIAPSKPFNVNLAVFLPSETDIQSVRNDFITYISRLASACIHVHVCNKILCTYAFLCVQIHRLLINNIPALANQGKNVEWHIPHHFMDEMSKKSEVVSYTHNSI